MSATDARLNFLSPYTKFIKCQLQSKVSCIINNITHLKIWSRWPASFTPASDPASWLSAASCGIDINDDWHSRRYDSIGEMCVKSPTPMRVQLNILRVDENILIENCIASIYTYASLVGSRSTVTLEKTTQST